MMRPIIHHLLALAIVLGRLGRAQTPSLQSEADCLAVLAQPNAPASATAAALRALATKSTEASIPVLQTYLASSEWSDLARGALETLDHPAANAALRQAAEAASGSILAGLLDSLGRRRDAGSVSLAARHLNNPDAAVAAAAARALGRIANEPAIEALAGAASQHPPPLPTHLVEALCVAADELLRHGGAPQLAARAVAPLDPASLPAHLLPSVLRVRVTLHDEGALLDVVGEVPHPATPLMAAHLVSHGDLPAPPDLRPETVAALPEPLRSALLIASPIATNGAADLMTNLAHHTDADLREMAIAIATRRGLPQALPLLWEQARESAAPISAEARRRLAAFPNHAADDFLLRQLRSSATISDVILALELLGQRAWTPAAESVLELTSHTDSTVRIAAWSALRDMVDARAMGPLLERWEGLTSPDELAAAEKTLYAAVTRRTADVTSMLVAQLSNALTTAASASRPPLLRALQRIGGPAAVRVVADTAASSEPAIREFAARVLIDWPDREALPWIEEMARSGEPPALRPLAVRAALRWTADLDLPPEVRAEQLLAWEAAIASDDDRRALLAALGRTPSVIALRRACELLANPNLVSEAASAMLKIADSAGSLPPEELRAALEQARSLPMDGKLREQIERRLAQLPAPGAVSQGAK